MIQCVLVSDLHGQKSFYRNLENYIIKNLPEAIFFAGDLFPSKYSINDKHEFIDIFLSSFFKNLKEKLQKNYPHFFIIMGNDDEKLYEKTFFKLEYENYIHYLSNRATNYRDYIIGGYSYIPPSPFLLKDWEKNDVSEYTDIGCVPIHQGSFSIQRNTNTLKTIKEDLVTLFNSYASNHFILLAHCPPYHTSTDMADIGHKFIDHVPLDPHIGSIAIRKWIEKKQPYLYLHGHAHESYRLTGQWNDTIGKTIIISGAGEQPEEAIIQFDLENPQKNKRIIIN